MEKCCHRGDNTFWICLIGKMALCESKKVGFCSNLVFIIIESRDALNEYYEHELKRMFDALE